MSRAHIRHRPRLLLALLCAAQFVVVLDITIVNVALPAIETELGFSRESLHWVISAYALAFGGTLLLGGRAADIAGARRVFVGGILLFTASSLLCGLAGNAGVLVAARGLQGLGAALVVPAALSMIAATFSEGRERNRALGAWGSTGALAAAAGVLLGGLLTELLSWHWIFLVNVPVGAIAIVLVPRLLADTAGGRPRRPFDVLGAALAAGGLGSLIYAFTLAGEQGWSAPPTLAALGGAGALLAAFGVWETRARDPLLPLSLLRIRTLAGANATGLIHGGVMLGIFLLLTFAMQELLELSAIETGAGLLASRAPSILWAKVASRVATRIGAVRTACLGMVAMAGSICLFARVSAGGSYAAELLPGLLLLGLAIPFVFVSLSIAALEGVPQERSGTASGLHSTSLWVGGAIGVAAVSALALPADLAGRAAGTDALVAGVHTGFWTLAGAAAVGVVIMVALIGRAGRASGRLPRRQTVAA
jgi:EmrB/QacA subfamily drug resistance transporter